MKRAYIDISIEGLNDLLKLYPSKVPGDYLVKSVEMSPLVEGGVRLNLEGDALPETYLDEAEPRGVKVAYEHVYDMNTPYQGMRVTLYDGDVGEVDAYYHNWKDGPLTETFSIIHDGKPYRPPTT